MTEKTHNQKLTDDDKREIYKLLAAGWQHKVIAKKFGVSRSTITNYKKRRKDRGSYNG